MSKIVIELLGILASLIVLASFLSKNEQTIRKINLVGAVFFVVYGLLSNAISVWFLNGVLVFVQIYHIYAKQKEDC